jgi:radical SAM protein with 4Fe4S-binding SPASM domain
VNVYIILDYPIGRWEKGAALTMKFRTKLVIYGFGRILPKSLLRLLQNKFIYNPRKKTLRLAHADKSLFDSVLFEVRTKCNGSCAFCAASVKNETRPDTTMPMSLYRKVIDELMELEFKGVVGYDVNNDPLLFKELPAFIKYARSHLPNAWIRVLTNGKALDEDIAAALLAAGINELSINDYNDDRNAAIPEKIRVVQEEILPKFYNKTMIKIGKTNYGPDPDHKEIFKFNLFRSRATVIKATRAGTAPNKKEKTQMPRGFCEHPFTQFNITTDGRVSMCSADLFFSDPMGDVSKQSLTEIWFGENFQKIRKSLMKDDREPIELCSKCDYYGIHKFVSIPARITHLLTERSSY